MLDAMDEVLLADRFAAALAAAPVVSCEVPLPPTMPAVKLSRSGLPIPVPQSREGPLFGPALRPGVAGASAVATRQKVFQGAELAKESDSIQAETEAEEAEELAVLTKTAHARHKEYNKLRQEAAVREAKLEKLQVQAQIVARDNLDAEDELAYMEALRGAAESELEAVAVRNHNEDADAWQYEFMKERVVQSLSEKKTLTSDYKRAVGELERKLQSEVARSSQLVNACKEAARQHVALEAHLKKARSQSSVQLERMREQNKSMGSGDEWVAQQMSASQERVREASYAQLEAATKSKPTNALLSVTNSLVNNREAKLEASIEKLRVALGCRDIDEVVEKLERASEEDHAPAAVAAKDGKGAAKGGRRGGGGKGSSSTPSAASSGPAKSEPILGGSVRPPLVFRMMLEAKTEAERRLMGKVNELTRQQGDLDKMLTSVDMGDLVDYKSRVNEMQSSQMDESRKLQVARRRMRECDERLHAARAGSEKLLEMLASVKVHLHKNSAPPTLTVVRNGAVGGVGSGTGDSTMFFLTEVEGEGDSERATEEEASEAGGVKVTLTMRDGAELPDKESAAGALTAGAAALRDLAAVEQQAHGHDSSSRLVEAGGDALRFLAAVEHRLGIVMPELRLHDARMRIKQSARIAARENKLVRTATQSAGGISRRRQSAHASRMGVGSIGDSLLQAEPEAPEPSPAPAELSRRRPSMTQLHARDDVDGPSSPHELAGAPSAESPFAAPGAAAPPSAARRPSSAATTRRTATPSATGERPRSAAVQQRSRSPAVPLLDSMHHHLSDVLEEVTHRKSAATSLNVRVQPYNDDEATGESKHMPAMATQKDKDFLWRVFQAFDTDGSGSISVVEVRSLFDRMSLEASQKKKGLQGTSDKSFKAAHKFIAQLFDDDLDGKLGKEELDRFFHIFNSDDDKLISWDEFKFHASQLIVSMRQREAAQDEAKAHVPTREELKIASDDALRHHEKVMRRKAQPPAPVAKPKGGVPSMLARQPSGTDRHASGERSRGARPGFA